ncbi:hypothetical protein HDU86_004428 [Geranomyces michiganensis]|nr:hypothetical protein HDU86_004428 [Geranomyces michiganensis]
MLVMCIIYGDLLSVSWAMSRHVTAAIYGHFAAGWWTCQVQGFIDAMWGIFAQMTFLGFTAERYISIVWQRDVTMRQMWWGIAVAGSASVFTGFLPFALQQNAGVMPGAVWCTPPWSNGKWQGVIFSTMGVVAIGSVFLGIAFMYWRIYITFARSAREARAAMQSNLNFSTMPEKRARLVPQPHPDFDTEPDGRRGQFGNKLDDLDHCEAANNARDDNVMGRDSGVASDRSPSRPFDESNPGYTAYSETMYAGTCDEEFEPEPRLLALKPIPPPRVASMPDKGKGRANYEHDMPRIIATATGSSPGAAKPPTGKSSKLGTGSKATNSATMINRSFDQLKLSFNHLNQKFSRKQQHDHMAPTRRLAVTLARQAFIIVAAYYVCLLPLFLCIMYNLFFGIPVAPWADLTAYVAAVTYTALNPLLFMTLNRQFSQATRDEFASWRRYIKTRVLRR